MENEILTIPGCIEKIIKAIEGMHFAARDPHVAHAQRALFLLDSLAEWARANVTDKPAAPATETEE